MKGVQPNKNEWRLLLKWVQRVFAIFALLFIAHYAWSEKAQLRPLLSHTNYIYLIASVFAWMSLNVIAAAGSAQLLNTSDKAIPFKEILKIHIKNLPARYIPGGIWHTVGRVSHFYQLGVNGTQLATFVFLENTMAAGVTLAIGGVGVWSLRNLDQWSYIAGLAFLGGATLLILAPFIVNNRRLNTFSRILFSNYFKALFWIALFWIIAGAIFSCYLLAFPVLATEIHPLKAAITYIFSWAIGFIALFSPQGVGVSEAIFSNIYSNKIPFGNMLVLVAGFRVIICAADVLSWGMSFLFTKSSA